MCRDVKADEHRNKQIKIIKWENKCTRGVIYEKKPHSGDIHCQCYEVSSFILTHVNFFCLRRICM